MTAWEDSVRLQFLGRIEPPCARHRRIFREMLMHDNTSILVTQRYTTTGGIEERSFVAALLWMTAKGGLDGGRDF